jgi:putative salt-induced outer membrane protein YdiY
VRVFLCLLLFAGVARAQIVNVQGAIAKPPDNNEVDGQIELKLAWSEGNAPIFDVSGAGSVLWKHDRFLSLAQARGEYGTAIGITTTRKSFEHLRERITLSCLWRWEVFAQHEYDQFRRLSLRALAGTGPALQILNEEDVALLAGVAYMFEYEELDDRAGTTDAGASYHEHRASFYVTGREQIADNVAFVQTFYAQPKLDSWNNYRLLGDAAVEVKLSKRIALTDGFVFDYDSRPPQGVKSWDTALRVGLVIHI